eukprot:11011071-Prorocentrum_lima.AAC.1
MGDIDIMRMSFAFVKRLDAEAPAVPAAALPAHHGHQAFLVLGFLELGQSRICLHVAATCTSISRV